VDVLVTFEAVVADKSKERVTATILQNVEVLDVYTHEKDGKGDWIVRLALNPTEAQYAVLAMTSDAQVWLIRRAPGDDATKGLEMASFRKLFR
jgi:Flp pilus assembly protein CpaB